LCVHTSSATQEADRTKTTLRQKLDMIQASRNCEKCRLSKTSLDLRLEPKLRLLSCPFCASTIQWIISLSNSGHGPDQPTAGRPVETVQECPRCGTTTVQTGVQNNEISILFRRNAIGVPPTPNRHAGRGPSDAGIHELARCPFCGAPAQSGRPRSENVKSRWSSGRLERISCPLCGEIGGTPAMSNDLTQFLVGYSRTGRDIEAPIAVRNALPQFSSQDIKELVTGILTGQTVEEGLRSYIRIRKHQPGQVLSDEQLLLEGNQALGMILNHFQLVFCPYCFRAIRKSDIFCDSCERALR
jgi:hypothetical protein